MSQRAKFRGTKVMPAAHHRVTMHDLNHKVRLMPRGCAASRLKQYHFLHISLI